LQAVNKQAKIKMQAQESIMAVYYHEVRDTQHVLKDRGGVEVFAGEEHQLITRTFTRPGDRYMSYRSQQVMSVPEFLLYLKALKQAARFNSPVAIPNQRRSGEARARGRSVD
jgi:hypothetical protein